MDATTLLNQYLPTWTPKSLPTSTSISTIDPTATLGLAVTLLEIRNEILTQTNTISLYFLSKKARGLAASITLINDQEYLATATNTENFPQITQEMFNATLNLKNLEWSYNLYAINLSVPFNSLFTILFGTFAIIYVIFGFIKKNHYFSICLSFGTLLEMIGYLSRTLAHYSWSNQNLYLCQIITLTIAPAFIMAGIYYLLAQLIIIYGENYSILKPRWFCYIFIICDVLSLLIQAIGGAIAAIFLKMFKNSKIGTYIMVGGIAFQVLSMSLFLILLIDFTIRSFKNSTSLKFSINNYFNLLLNTKKGVFLRNEFLEPFYNSNYSHIRSRKFFNYMPLIIIISVLFIYIRCIYRVVELSEGWRGYLITHEEFIFIMDALMVLLTCLIYLFFHPGIMFGKDPISTKSTSKLLENKIDYFEKGDNSSISSFDPKDWDIKTLPLKSKSNDLLLIDHRDHHHHHQGRISPNSRDCDSKNSSLNIPISQKYNNPYLQPTRFSQFDNNSNSIDNHRINNSVSTSETYTNNNNNDNIIKQVDSSNSSEFEFNPIKR